MERNRTERKNDSCAKKKKTEEDRLGYFRLVMVYNYSRFGLIAFRSYASDQGSWSEEARPRLMDMPLPGLVSAMRMGVVVSCGGKVVNWLAYNWLLERWRPQPWLVYALSLDSSKLAYSPPSLLPTCGTLPFNPLLGCSPDGVASASSSYSVPSTGRMRCLFPPTTTLVCGA